MNPSRIAELTVSEFKHLARGAVTDFFADLLGDPDEGLVVRDEFAKELKCSLEAVGTGGTTSSLSDVKARLESAQ
jgi:hypothetical protein